MSVSPFEFVKAINETKEDLFETKGYQDSDYNAFIINRNFSMFPDTVFLANEINMRLGSVPGRLQFKVYKEFVPKKKRFAKWYKQTSDDNVELISKEYQISKQKAQEVIDLFNEEQLESIRKKYFLGGKGKRASE